MLYRLYMHTGMPITNFPEHWPSTYTRRLAGVKGAMGQRPNFWKNLHPCAYSLPAIWSNTHLIKTLTLDYQMSETKTIQV